jgi:hypothetical protein
MSHKSTDLHALLQAELYLFLSRDPHKCALRIESNSIELIDYWDNIRCKILFAYELVNPQLLVTVRGKMKRL